jgi:transketolase N-terminal domain/subunit/transketolase C-terminal domain/subunit
VSDVHAGPAEAGLSVLDGPLARLAGEQAARNALLLQNTPGIGTHVRSEVLPFTLDFRQAALAADADAALAALEKTAARIAIESLVSLARVGDIDHLGGGLELIPALLMTLAGTDYERRHFAIEHGHTSIGYYAALAALGFLERERVVSAFRRSLDMAGHVSWVPGGTQLGSGRLGVMVPVSTGLALALKASKGADALVVCHTGDAGWVSGQAMNGFIGASLHGAPVVFVMHRNGIQLSGTTAQILDRDPRPYIATCGIEILEIPTLHDRPALFDAYHRASELAQNGRPALIYPVGFSSSAVSRVTVRTFGETYGILAAAEEFASAHQVPLDTEVWIPGSLMSFRDVHAMLECLFFVNRLPGGEGHHDGGMKGRNAEQVLANPMLELTASDKAALQRLRDASPRVVVTAGRPSKGSPNLVLGPDDVKGIQLPGTDKPVSARAGSEAAYAAIAKKYPERCFFVSCDLNPSTKLGKAAALVPAGHSFEMSIQEQAASLINDGLSFAGAGPQLNVFATFAAFMEGIAREGFEMWRYQRNLNGLNEGLNVVMHLAHVGACTGRDHFSGWSLDWINLALGYLPYLRRFYAPADARAAFLAVKDAAAGYGGHIIAIPRDNLPVLTKMGTNEPLWNADDEWTPVSLLRQAPGANVAILAVGAPSFVAAAASAEAAARGVATDVYVINGFPLPDRWMGELRQRYRRILTIEDGLIGTPAAGPRGFAAFVAGQLYGSGVELEHFGIVDPQIAPSNSFMDVWAHYGMTQQLLTAAVLR